MILRRSKPQWSVQLQRMWMRLGHSWDWQDITRYLLEISLRLVFHYNLVEKRKQKLWTTQCVEIFEQLKQFLTNALVLRITYLDKDFVVCIDACKEGPSGVMMQEGHVLCYDSRKLNEYEVNYVTHDLELATIIHTLKMWRHYLLGRKFTLMTYYSEFEFEIK